MVMTESSRTCIYRQKACICALGQTATSTGSTSTGYAGVLEDEP
jgi:hypothetical protein